MNLEEGLNYWLELSIDDANDEASKDGEMMMMMMMMLLVVNVDVDQIFGS